jgi:hypothetical protein
MIAALRPGQILPLENLRIHAPTGTALHGGLPGAGRLLVSSTSR